MHGKDEGRWASLDAGIVHDDLAAHKGVGYLVPPDLSVSEAPIRRVALIGACLLEDFAFQYDNASKAHVDVFVTNNLGGVPDLSSTKVREYDFQVIQIALRNVIYDSLLWRVDHRDDVALTELFEESCSRLEMFLDDKMKWNSQYGLLTFVVNFLVPQQNPNGRLFPRYHLSNIQYFIEKLNERLERIVRKYKNSYLLDIDKIAASLGRRYIQDDIVSVFSHGALIPTPGEVLTRIEYISALSDYYEVGPRTDLRLAIWAELCAMYRTIRQIDSVKIVVVDLDDTLWYGVSGEWTDAGSELVEGWPISIAEALMYLKKRGILLAIISKNDESRIRGLWPKLFGEKWQLDDFVSVKINWLPKPENMSEILEGVNLLPRNVVFIDDNPVERAAMKSAFPDMRVIGRHPYHIRRTLLWSSETQVASITEESANRTEMVRAQLNRETDKKGVSREDFLANAAPKIEITQIFSVEHPKFERAFELLNKTNQFNTTGRRWMAPEIASFIDEGGKIYAFQASDIYTDYGLVGVVLVRSNLIEQLVMSCRVLGYDIEIAVMAYLVNGLGEATAILIETDANFPCRDLFKKSGFFEIDGVWRSGAPIHIPAHIRLIAN